MKLQNNSPVPTEAVKPLLAFVLRRCPLAALLARFDLHPAKKGFLMGGLAQMKVPGGPWLKPSLVELWVSKPGTYNYPQVSQHVPELAAVTLASWEEEFVLVCAHEARHIAQFWTGACDDAHDLEVDAEAFALETLSAYRHAGVGKRAA